MAAPDPARAATAGRSERPRVAIVIPTLNEEEPIGEVIRAIPAEAVDEIIVVDSGSEDRTVVTGGAEPREQRVVEARVVVEGRKRGTGRREPENNYVSMAKWPAGRCDKKPTREIHSRL